jgi:hypothetical protein
LGGRGMCIAEISISGRGVMDDDIHTMYKQSVKY